MFTASTLTIGDVSVVVRPIASAHQLRETLGAIATIRGIDGIAVERLVGTTAHVRVHAEQPVALASELRAALRQRVASCAVIDGQIHVELATSVSGREADPVGSKVRTPRQRRSFVPPSDDRTDVAAVDAINQVGDVSVFLFDLDGRFTAAAGGLHRRLGHQFALMQGKTAQELSPPPAWQVLLPGYDDALAGRTKTLDVLAPGGVDTYEAAFRPLSSDGAVIGGMVTVRDVTRQRETEGALAESLAVLSAVIDESATPFAFLAPGGQWARVNSATHDLLGEAGVASLSSGLLDRVGPHDAHRLGKTLREMVDGRCDRDLAHIRLRRHAAGWIDVAARMTAVRTASGLLGVVVEFHLQVSLGGAL